MITPESMDGRLNEIERGLGFLPNLLREVSCSQAALEVYLDANGALRRAALTRCEREAVMLAISAFNHCHYCTPAHRTMAIDAGMDPDDADSIAQGELPDEERLRTLCQAVWMLQEKRGWLGADDLKVLAHRGVDRPQLYELVAMIGIKTISNYINHIANTEVDEAFSG